MTVFTITLNKPFSISIFCIALSFLGLLRAAAQGAPIISRFSAPPAPGPFSQANLAPVLPGQTKVVRIYLGPGYFDRALAAKLRPILAKAFASSKNDALKVVPDAAVATPGKAESRSKLTSAPPL
jgi:hypothetical protein